MIPSAWALRSRNAMPERDAIVLVALLRVYARDGRATVRDVVAETDYYSSPSTVHKALAELAELGLVAWERGTAGSLRPLVVAVPLRSIESAA